MESLMDFCGLVCTLGRGVEVGYRWLGVGRRDGEGEDDIEG